MESFPQAPEKEIKFLGDVTTNGFSRQGDTVGQAAQADKETGLWLDLRLLYIPDHLVSLCACMYGPKHFYTYMCACICKCAKVLLWL